MPEAFLHLEGVEYETATMVGTSQRLCIDIQYHPRKASVVADALSTKTAPSSALITKEPRVQADFERAKIAVAVEDIRAQLARLTMQPILWQRIVEAQVIDSCLARVLNEMET